MSIYVGDTEYDLHYSTTGKKVNRSTFLGEEKIWPLYEFSFYNLFLMVYLKMFLRYE